jgi:hypothetical protein
MSGAGAGQGIDGAMLGIVLGANAGIEPIKLIEAAAVHGGSEAGWCRRDRGRPGRV